MSQKNKGSYLSRQIKKDMFRLTQRSPWPSPPSLKVHLCYTLSSSMPPVTEGVLLSKAHFPRVPWICIPPPSAQGVSSFSLLLCLQQHHSYKSNSRNLLHSSLDPAVSTINPCCKLSFAVEFIYLFCCCSSNRSALLSLLWPETHYAAQV